jgi:hypothetical protein
VRLAVGGDHFRQQGAGQHLRRGDAHRCPLEGLALGDVGHGAVEVLDHLVEQRIQFAPISDSCVLRVVRSTTRTPARFPAP